MKILARLVGLLKRSSGATGDDFEARLKSLGQPQTPLRATRRAQPNLFRRTAVAQ